MPLPDNPYARLPSVDSLLAHLDIAGLKERYGHTTVVAAVRAVLAERREALKAQPDSVPDTMRLVADCRKRLEAEFAPSLRPVFNLTGTVLHTNLGRALLAESAIDAVLAVLARPSNLEYELTSARRGDRDDHIDGLIRELTGAEAATVVNNNAAAVFLLLNTLAMRKEVIVSVDELIEIGGIPHSRHHVTGRGETARSGHHQPYSPEGLRRSAESAHGLDHEGIAAITPSWASPPRCRRNSWRNSPTKTVCLCRRPAAAR